MFEYLAEQLVEQPLQFEQVWLLLADVLLPMHRGLLPQQVLQVRPHNLHLQIRQEEDEYAAK